MNFKPTIEWMAKVILAENNQLTTICDIDPRILRKRFQARQNQLRILRQHPVPTYPSKKVICRYKKWVHSELGQNKERS